MEDLLEKLRLRCGNDGNLYEVYDEDNLRCRSCDSVVSIENIGTKIIEDVKYVFAQAIHDAADKIFE